jgi:hypothetical protein
MQEKIRTVEARLLVYGYSEDLDRLVGKDIIENLDAIHQDAQELLHILTQKRRTKKERTRPIVFIGSGGGASLIKRALLKNRLHGREDAVATSSPQLAKLSSLAGHT